MKVKKLEVFIYEIEVSHVNEGTRYGCRNPDCGDGRNYRRGWYERYSNMERLYHRVKTNEKWSFKSIGVRCTKCNAIGLFQREKSPDSSL